MEDGLVENISAVIFFITGVITAYKGFRVIKKSRNPLVLLILFTMSLLFFVFAGEEISWGQRIFGFETNEFLEANNWQNEMNFHNLQTDVFNILYHYGALVFLVIVPLLRRHVSKLLDKLHLTELQGFIAPPWLGLTMLAFIGMIDPRFIFTIEKPWAAVLYLSALFIGLLLAFIKLFNLPRMKNNYETFLIFASLLLIFLGVVTSYFQANGPSPNAISEYKEMVIALGLLVYILQLKVPNVNYR